MLQAALLIAAFWVAVFEIRRHAPDSDESLRFVLGLGLGAVFAHLAWALLNFAQLVNHPRALLDLTTGFTVLAVPLGLFATARGASRRYLAIALGSLPRALATARAGCLVAGCCHGTLLPHPSLGLLYHPTQALEIAGLMALHVAVRRSPPRAVPALVLIGFGSIRLAVEPWRAPPPLGEGLLPAWTLAALWICAGLGLALDARPLCAIGGRVVKSA